MRIPLLSLVAVLTFGCGSKVDLQSAEDGGGDAETDASDDTLESDTHSDEGGLPDTPIEDVPAPEDAGPAVPTDKLDLLFVIDNSISMADKQGELARAIPGLIRAVTTPELDASGMPKTKAVADLHVGVITSSLGSHGTSACDPSITSAHGDDRGHLLPRVGEGSGSGFVLDASGNPVAATCPTPVAASALTWTFSAGTSAAKQLQTAVSCVVESAKDDGCGYEETLESMYHFLVDPAPYASAKVACTFGVSGDACGSSKIVVSGVDSELVAERAAFLRPDSTVAVVILSDEDDASLKPAGLDWLPWAYGKGSMQRGWTNCANVPDDFEPESKADFDMLHTTYGCYSCFENSSDPACKKPWAIDPLNNDVDGRNLRAFQQTKRFGYNFLWGRSRYVQALGSKTIAQSDGALAPNPLFSGGRSPANVILATIVGVPKQLVSGADGVPKTLSAADWDKIISPDLAKRDPHMIASIAPRAGIPKYAGDASIDPVNGGDRDILDGDDLQYACIGPRAITTKSFDCEGPDADKKNPLCTATGQPRFKAFPGLRFLRVAHDLGDRAVVASICDASLSGAVTAVVRRLQPLLK